jgi:prepilin-type N-terminal cleavage/methylation domain-containing protein/prepilin-type processing-associated H-X9-DG protein
MNRSKPGFTMVELMIVLAIIAILIALLLPAIQSAREAARRTQCTNNMAQLGVGIANYASTHSVLPPGVVNDKGPIQNVPKGYHHSWVVQILPYIGQANTYNHLDLRLSVYHPANDTVAEVRIATLLCPSSSFSPTQTNYVGCHNDVDAAIDSNNHGVLYLNSRVRYDEITDGTNQTILLGEIVETATLGWVSGTRSTLRNTGVPMNDRSAYNRPKNLPSVFSGELGRDTMFETIGTMIEGELWPVERTGGFASVHGSTCNFVFCDGSVRLLKQSVDTRVYRLLGNRADGEPISSDSY